MKNYDVIVLGIGGMGSSTVLSLAKRGAKVLGLEQWSLAHDRGSSHGEQRMIRQAYFEHSDYVPFSNGPINIGTTCRQNLDKIYFIAADSYSPDHKKVPS